ncbi:MAG TPA: hypothetical protein VG389_21470 [Myxococcota bacterium]|jgi:acetyl esterase/lipase|nr:hypothetical protein [Myxococcota bacterium]
MIGARGAALAALLGLAGCGPVDSNATSASRDVGLTGWFAVAAASIELTGAPDPEDVYAARFSSVPLGRYTPPCDWLTGAGAAAAAPGPVYVFVHGIKGDGPEWWPVVPVVASLHPGAMYMFRWLPYEGRDALVEALAGGVSRLGQCLAGRAKAVVILAHSAGGVLAARAAASIKVPAGGAPVHVVTVAAPLAGTGERKGRSDGAEEAKFLLDLGTSLPPYAAAAAGVDVTHLRTHWPADTVMKPDEHGRAPNDPTWAVPGARVVELPAELTHDGALLFAARAIGTAGYKGK